jgi:hypothetical protein
MLEHLEQWLWSWRIEQRWTQLEARRRRSQRAIDVLQAETRTITCECAEVEQQARDVLAQVTSSQHAYHTSRNATVHNSRTR